MVDLDAYEAALEALLDGDDLNALGSDYDGVRVALGLFREMRAAALVDPGRPSMPAVTATATSQEMRRRAFPRSGTLRLEIVTLISGVPIRWAPGHTDSELEGLTGRAHQSVSAARNGLVRDGWLTAATWGNGTPITRRTASGNPAQVWRLTGAARRALGLGGFG